MLLLSRVGSAFIALLVGSRVVLGGGRAFVWWWKRRGPGVVDELRYRHP